MFHFPLSESEGVYIERERERERERQNLNPGLVGCCVSCQSHLVGFRSGSLREDESLLRTVPQRLGGRVAHLLNLGYGPLKNNLGGHHY